MATEEVVKGPASYFPSIEKKYGKPISHWMKVLEHAGALKHMELVSQLKTGHQLGHGHANALVAWYLAKKRPRGQTPGTDRVTLTPILQQLIQCRMPPDDACICEWSAGTA